ncbi:hypothetical protein ACHAW5_005448 [Stephanodiscus triporus]|uniref:Myb-like domain-containing protein n=1 Tax=Stephanodiscus triporus TaxID=2934178 RepID=A0ABD3QH85_9STRA
MSKSRSRTWTDKEDVILLNLVLSLGESDRIISISWAVLALKLPRRKGKQARDRWTNNINPLINWLPFTCYDGVMLFCGHWEYRYRKRWVEISERVFFNARSPNQVKNWWNTGAFKSFVALEYGNKAYNITNNHPEDGTRQRLVGMANEEPLASPRASALLLLAVAHGRSPRMAGLRHWLVPGRWHHCCWLRHMVTPPRMAWRGGHLPPLLAALCQLDQQ